MGEENEKLMDMLGDIEQIEVFKTKVVKDLIFFKWNTYAKWNHYIGTSIHLIYTTLFCIYVNQVYLESNLSNKKYILGAMGVCLLYNAVYDLTQLIQ